MATQAPRILLVDDEQSVQTLLAYPLRKEGYEVVPALDGREALERLREHSFDLIVLDLMLPHVDGFEVCRQVRARSSVPIIMLTASAEEIDKVLGLELGADDYITKPFSVREFRSRVKAVLRRAALSRTDETFEEPLEDGDLRIDFEQRAVSLAGRDIQLTYVEFEILAALARNPGRVYNRMVLLERVWGDASYRDPRTVDVHIRHLREKLETDPKRPELIHTVQGSRLPLPGPMMRRPALLGSLRNKLALVFFAITAAAFAVIYFFFVPQLESNLEASKLDDLGRVAKGAEPCSRRSWAGAT